MIPLVPTSSPTSSPTSAQTAPLAGGWNLAALVQDMVRAWIAHHQRLADLGIGADI
ncbi:hypothetical protein Q8W71_19820 [Methylobacterium sp. NEAU 140]|uniref:hypothetical protein n=1 Tax=Methylobacterium sp. NEAU 140 TaxID=3064945 RepID=UPI002734459E|nr:hypothetical protein [Methylobacterium sp. NEAU 140]MDP4024882.1 hypothetical protein [Methylobacterium sp. NEAU 140]